MHNSSAPHIGGATHRVTTARPTAGTPFAGDLATDAYSIIELLTDEVRSVRESSKQNEEKIQRLTTIIRQLEFDASMDEMTGVRNRRSFMQEAGEVIRRSTCSGDVAFVFYMDVDNLKSINDLDGHAAGDGLLLHAAEAIRGAFRATDLVARVGGDEFAALARSATSDVARGLYDRLQGEITRINSTGRCRHPIALSVGVAAFDPARPTSLADLLELADRNMYLNKLSRRGSLSPVSVRELARKQRVVGIR